MNNDDAVLIESRKWNDLLMDKHIIIHPDCRGFAVVVDDNENPSSSSSSSSSTTTTTYTAGDNLPATIRILGPKSIMTRDYRVERLNILVDEDGVITGAYMG